MLVFSSISLRTLWLGKQITPSAAVLRACSPVQRNGTTPAAFAFKGRGDKPQSQSAAFARGFGNHVAGARAGAPAQPRDNEHGRNTVK